MPPPPLTATATQDIDKWKSTALCRYVKEIIRLLDRSLLL